MTVCVRPKMYQKRDIESLARHKEKKEICVDSFPHYNYVGVRCETKCETNINSIILLANGPYYNNIKTFLIGSCICRLINVFKVTVTTFYFKFMSVVNP